MVLSPREFVSLVSILYLIFKSIHRLPMFFIWFRWSKVVRKFTEKLHPNDIQVRLQIQVNTDIQSDYSTSIGYLKIPKCLLLRMADFWTNKSHKPEDIKGLLGIMGSQV